MIQFLGLHLDAAKASVAILGRDLRISARAETQMVNVTRDPATTVAEVPPAEWVRAGAYALQEAYFQLEPKARKPWGVGLSGPSGWIALDVDYQPLSPLWIVPPPVSVLDVLGRWLGENPRVARRINVLLSPKDYFRFAISGGLAADVASASRLGLLATGVSQWSEEAVRQAGLEFSWLPPVFDTHVTTGRLSEDGIRRTSLPGGAWLVAGAHEREAAVVDLGNLRDRRLRVAPGRDGGRLLAYGVEGLSPITAPPGWEVLRAARAGDQVLEREIGPAPDGVPPDADPVVAEERRALETAGFEVTGIEAATGAAELGTAALAAIGSGLVRGWDQYYRNR